MSSGSFRFLHAGDFHLHQPLYGVSEVPTHLRDLFLDAPYDAAAKVFQTAIEESVDFIVLTGDLIDIRRAGPRGPVFLAEWMEKLQAKSIEVYWAGGAVEVPEDWPNEWLENPILHRFGFDSIEEVMQERKGSPLALILGVSGGDLRKVRLAEYRSETLANFAIGMAHGITDAELLIEAPRRMHYWALGGKPLREQLLVGPVTAFYSGSPQGRCPQEAGACGCTIVHGDDKGNVRLQHIATDVVRWHTERIELHDHASKDDLYCALRERALTLSEGAGGRHVFVTWKIAGGGPLGAKLRSGKLAADLIDKLRDEFDRKTPVVWSVELETEIPQVFPSSYYDEETILGDYLRLAREQDARPDGLTLAELRPMQPELAAVGPELEIHDSALRSRVLRHAAMMGIDLLRGGQDDDSREEKSK